MTDYVWPDDLVPYAMSFYLQPHTGGSESPFNRVTKVYGLSAPRWVCRLAVKGGESVKWGEKGVAVWGQRMDALISKLKGRQNRIEIYDFRRADMSSPHWPRAASNSAAALGATTMTITGLSPGAKIYNGDYIGGDGRPHIISDGTFGFLHVAANSSGEAIVTFEPPLQAAVGVGEAVFGNPTGLFRLASDDVGENSTEVDQLTNYVLDFVEDLQEPA